jgi:hypothetical protein
MAVLGVCGVDKYAGLGQGGGFVAGVASWELLK